MIERERLPERAARIGEEVARRFECFVERFPFVGDARGLGAMRALELVKDRGTQEPDKDLTDRVIRKAYENGLLLVGAGTYGNVIRTLMPLVVTDDELTEGLDVLEKALAERVDDTSSASGTLSRRPAAREVVAATRESCP